MQKPEANNKSGWVIFFLSLVLIVINIIRILHVPITHDEAITVMNYLPSSYWEIVTNHWPTANNHILHTGLTKFVTGIFGKGIFFVRLPALLAQLVFLFFSYKTLQRLVPYPIWIITGFFLLNLNPFLFDFWGLSRGYGLSLAFMAGSVYYLVCYMRNYSARQLWWNMLMGMLAVYSGFVLLNFYLALLVIVVFLIVRRQKGLAGSIIPVLLTTILLGVLIAYPIKQLKDADQLYFGGDHGFIKDTIGSLLRESLYLDKSNNGLLIVLSWVVTIIVLLAGIYWCVRLLKKDKKAGAGLVLWLLLVIPATSVVMQHILLGNKFIIERAALFFVPLFMLHLVYWLYTLEYVKAGKILVTTLAMLAVVNFVQHLSFAATRSWNYDRYNELVLARITAGHHQTDKIKVRVYWQFAPSFQYYTTYKYPERFEQVNFDQSPATADTSYDYYYIHQDDLPYISHVYIKDTSFFEGKYILLRKPER